MTHFSFHLQKKRSRLLNNWHNFDGFSKCNLKTSVLNWTQNKLYLSKRFEKMGGGLERYNTEGVMSVYWSSDLMLSLCTWHAFCLQIEDLTTTKSAQLHVPMAFDLWPLTLNFDLDLWPLTLTFDHWPLTLNFSIDFTLNWFLLCFPKPWYLPAGCQ